MSSQAPHPRGAVGGELGLRVQNAAVRSVRTFGDKDIHGRLFDVQVCASSVRLL